MSHRTPSESDTRQKLIMAGTEEFFRHGYQKASLRRICAACGLTTGAFYFLFSSKDELLCSIVDPVAEQCVAMTEQLFRQELADPSSGPDNDRQLAEFQYRHRREFLIILEGCDGSSRQDLKEQFLSRLEEYFSYFFTAALDQKPDPELIKLLVSLRYQGISQILKGNYSLKQTLYLNSVLSQYADGGTQTLIRYINQMSEKQPYR
ncbi:MAG: TetR/AcrR family transcriptional regulator [Eubacteriales bacterium]|nr:TetR/AcrR family transcriptional regulator [Eubacteriales bacterium]